MSSGSPKAILDEAARNRAACQLRVRRGAWTVGSFVRVDSAGVILKAPGLALMGGEDLHVWFNHAGTPYTFDASVLRTGVPVPDRSSHGLLLGFIDGFQVRSEAPTAPDPSLGLDVLAPNGGGLDLLGSDAHVTQLGVDEISFTVSRDQALKFVEGGQVQVRFRGVGADLTVTGRVHALSSGDGHYLYGVHFEGSDDPSHLVAVVEAFRQRVAP